MDFKLRFDHFVLNSLLGLSLIAPTLSHAQAFKPEIEVNLGVLEELENYQPPPMFGEKPKKQRKTSYAPPPLPKHKPDFIPAAIPASPAAAAELETVETEIIFQSEPFEINPVPPMQMTKLPPKPQQRPDTFHASESFIREARENFDAAPVLPKTPQASGDTLEQTLVEPNAYDILDQITDEHIEDIAEPPPQPIPLAEPVESGLIETKTEKISLGYQPDVTELTETIQKMLQNRFVEQSTANTGKRIEIQAFASPQEQGESHARRVSLARALAIREFLVEKNFDPKHIDIRALGTNTEETPLDRVDILVLSQ